MLNSLGKEFQFFNLPMIIIAEYTVIFLAIFVILFWFTKDRENKIMLMCASIAFVLAEIIGKFAGLLHFNHQPFAVLSNTNQLIEKAINNSFPSDHTILFFSFCMSFWLFKKGKWILWILLAILVLNFTYLGRSSLSIRCNGRCSYWNYFCNNNLLYTSEINTNRKWNYQI